jgi:hypothetical protein
MTFWIPRKKRSSRLCIRWTIPTTLPVRKRDIFHSTYPTFQKEWGQRGRHPLPDSYRRWGFELWSTGLHLCGAATVARLPERVLPPSITHMYPAYKLISLWLRPYRRWCGANHSGREYGRATLLVWTKRHRIHAKLYPRTPSPIYHPNFELLTDVMWRCRTSALGYESGHKVRTCHVYSE